MAGAEFIQVFLLLVLWQFGFIMPESAILQILWPVQAALCWALLYLIATRTAGQALGFVRLARENALTSHGVLTYAARRFAASGRTQSRYLPVAALIVGTLVLFAAMGELLMFLSADMSSASSPTSRGTLYEALQTLPAGMLLTAAGAWAVSYRRRGLTGQTTTTSFAVLLAIGGMSKLDDASGMLLLLSSVSLGLRHFRAEQHHASDFGESQTHD